MIQRVISQLGIEAWLVEDYAVPIVAIDFAFRGGAAQDTPDRAGLGQLMASLLDEGAGPLDDEAFQLRLEEDAVELSFNAGRDHVSGSLRTLADRKQRAFELLRLALSEPRFDADPVERVRQSLLAGLRREVNEPNAMAAKAFYAALFPDHPYGRWPRGSIESIGAIGRDEIVAQHRRILAKDNLVVSIVGAIDAVDTAALLDSVFGELPSKALLRPVREIVPAAFGERRVLPLDVPQTVLQFALPGVKRHDDDYLPAFVTNHILGGGAFSSWLFQNVREKRGLAYSVSTSLATLERTSFVGGGVATRNDRAAESLDVILSDIARMAKDGPSPEELDSAKRYITGSYALRFDTSTKIANQLTHIQLEGFGIDYVDRRNALVNEVSMDDVHRVSRRLFAGTDPFVVAVGQPEGIVLEARPAA